MGEQFQLQIKWVFPLTPGPEGTVIFKRKVQSFLTAQIAKKTISAATITILLSHGILPAGDKAGGFAPVQLVHLSQWDDETAIICIMFYLVYTCRPNLNEGKDPLVTGAKL